MQVKLLLATALKTVLAFIYLNCLLSTTTVFPFFSVISWRWIRFWDLFPEQKWGDLSLAKKYSEEEDVEVKLQLNHSLRTQSLFDTLMRFISSSEFLWEICGQNSTRKWSPPNFENTRGQQLTVSTKSSCWPLSSAFIFPKWLTLLWF